MLDGGGVVGLLEQPKATIESNATAFHGGELAVISAQTQPRSNGFNKVRASAQSSYTTDMSFVLVAPAWFRYLSWGFALLLLLCAGLQFNDPDPLRWIAFYAGAAAISFILPLRPRVHPVAVVLGMAAAIWCGYLVAPVVGLVSFADLFAKMSDQRGLIEQAREAVGTGLVSLWIASAATIAKRLLKPAAIVKRTASDATTTQPRR